MIGRAGDVSKYFELFEKVSFLFEEAEGIQHWLEYNDSTQQHRGR